MGLLERPRDRGPGTGSGVGARAAAGLRHPRLPDLSATGKPEGAANEQEGVGSLTVVGTGIELGSHVTADARAAIERAGLVLCILAEPPALAWLAKLNPRVRSLDNLYALGRPRTDVYKDITEAVLHRVREGLDVCFVVYGHPGMFVRPSHDAIARAREEGFRTRLLPGISAEDCLFADLAVDPALTGWHSFDATAFLIEERRADPTVALVLWQIGVVGSDRVTSGAGAVALPRLVKALLRSYPAAHEVTVYEASPYAGFGPSIRRVPLAELRGEHVTALSTLYVPPYRPGSG